MLRAFIRQALSRELAKYKLNLISVFVVLEELDRFH
jgi:hypothetical protein